MNRYGLWRGISAAYYMGWDVGGWYCDKNKGSQDGIVILDPDRKTLGTWRGSLRDSICEARTTREWLCNLFSKCEVTEPDAGSRFTMAIDTPLGFPEEFVRLVKDRRCTEPSAICQENRYLYRETERYVASNIKQPLSPVQNQIGSQATKGMHVLARFAPVIESCGVWTDRNGFRAIEAYPAASRGTLIVKEFLRHRKNLACPDLDDARICAFIAYLFATDRESLAPPGDHVPQSEGWIWIPRRLE